MLIIIIHCYMMVNPLFSQKNPRYPRPRVRVQPLRHRPLLLWRLGLARSTSGAVAWCSRRCFVSWRIFWLVSCGQLGDVWVTMMVIFESLQRAKRIIFKIIFFYVFLMLFLWFGYDLIYVFFSAPFFFVILFSLKFMIKFMIYFRNLVDPKIIKKIIKKS